MPERSFKSAVSALLAAVILLMPLISTGCNSKEAKQKFVDRYIEIVESLESDPKIAQEGREAFIKYARSGYTDLKSADMARESYEASIVKDEEGLESLEQMNKPDSQSEEIAKDLEDGIAKVDEANNEFSVALSNAKDQTIEERALISEKAPVVLSITAIGMESILSSMERLIEYIANNNLEGNENIEEWYDRLKSEYEGLKGYVK
ncbi:MAG: hypothetical protein JW738_06215 [Actinobacteria bacterium]|nr:hypothetical protein [Actinomycetota bacterium]